MSVGGVFAYANTYNVLISQEHSNYEVKEESFTEIQSGCTEEYIGSAGSIEHRSVADISTSKTGTLVLNNCLAILDNGHSRGDGLYTINQTGSDVSAECDMTTTKKKR